MRIYAGRRHFLFAFTGIPDVIIAKKILRAQMKTTVITGTGSYIPKVVKLNSEFLENDFHHRDGTSIDASPKRIIDKFEQITGISERRYAQPSLKASDMAVIAAERALEESNTNPEHLNYIIVAHNFGDVDQSSSRSDIFPSLAARVKHKLGIQNPDCVAYDILFGCPGWVEGIIQAEAFLKSGMAQKVLVIGSETLSRVIDPHDRDSLIYSDGAGACILEQRENESRGIISHCSQSFTENEAYFLYNDVSYKQSSPTSEHFIKMHGRKVYEFALKMVPAAIKKAIDLAEVSITDVKKIFLHQANEKMDEAIVTRLYNLYETVPPEDVMPMIIHKLGNSSVATVPTLLDLVFHKELDNHELNDGDIIVLASVGAGMNINAIVYRV